MLSLDLVHRRVRAATFALAGALTYALVASPRPVCAAPLSAAARVPIDAAFAALAKGDGAAFARAFAPRATILDEISPFVFAGDDAAGVWFARLARVNADNAITGERAIPAAPRAGSVEGDAAYAVVPVRIAYRQRGRTIVENGAWTFGLRNARGAWKIVSAAFSPATS